MRGRLRISVITRVGVQMLSHDLYRSARSHWVHVALSTWWVIVAATMLLYFCVMYGIMLRAAKDVFQGRFIQLGLDFLLFYMFLGLSWVFDDPAVSPAMRKISLGELDFVFSGL